MGEYDIECTQMVLQKESSNPKVVELLHTNSQKVLQKVFEQYEDDNSLCKIAYPWAKEIINSRQFIESDIIHLHLIHNNIFSILDLSLIASLKPTVWTWHDPWALTGHCIHPLNCTNWKTGCSSCPHLDYTFPLIEDTAKEHWNTKKVIAQKSDISIVVASQFLENMCQQSPIAHEYPNIFRIPFGLDLSFKENVQPEEITKSRLGIASENVVIFFRCDYVEFKGLEYIIEALKGIDESENVSLLTVGNRELPDDILNKYHCVQLPWQNSEKDYYDLLNCASFLLMPSIAETFGFMTLEAMALAKPVIAFRDTALEEIISHGEDGLLASYRNSSELNEAIENLISNPEKTRQMGLKGQKKILSKFSFDKYKKALANCYAETYNNWHSKPEATSAKISNEPDLVKAENLVAQFDEMNNLSHNKNQIKELRELSKRHLLKNFIISFLKKVRLIKIAVKIKRLLKN